MTTIGETLDEIPFIRLKIQRHLRRVEVLDDQFLTSLNNWLATYEFDLLAHASMEESDSSVHVDASLSGFRRRYRQLVADPVLYQEWIRISNMEGLSFLWFEIEQLIDRVCNSRGLGIGRRRTMRRMYDDLLGDLAIDKAETTKTLATFDGIRLTRNALHNGGIHKPRNDHEERFEFDLAGVNYAILPHEQVTPLRLVDVVEYLLAAYEVLEAAIARASRHT